MRYRLFIIVALALLSTAVRAQQIVFTPQWTAQSQFAGYYVAQEMGFYKDAGVDVVIEHITSSELALSHLQSGKSNAITMMLFDAIYHIGQGVEMVNILQTAQRSGHVIVVRNDDINKIEDLRGKKVGTWKSNFNQLIQIMDLDKKLEIRWVPFIQSINLYISGAIDATMAMSYNELYQIHSSGFEDKKVFSMSDIGYDYPEEGVYISRDYYEKYPDKAKAFAEASRRGWEWAHEHPEEALDIVMKVIAKEQLPASRNHQKWMLDEVLKQQCAPGESKPTFNLDAKKVGELNELLIRHGRISKEISVDKIQGR
ncbi:MAG: ABC transporter substrate-binding protein [Alistipes sp.]|nr:ABC transporter substrate-binding protein [Alistipes sp.]